MAEQSETVNAAYFKTGATAAEDVSSALLSEGGANYVSLVSAERSAIDKSMRNMGYIVLIIIICAAALAVIVLYNLANINVMERTREAATVKALGFYPHETARYVLGENVVLAILGALIGLLAGKFLHLYVMSCVAVEAFSFDVRISFWSYALAFALTAVFAVATNLFMRIKLGRIKAAESLKAVE